MNRPRIFLAYASEDKLWAEAFADALERQGLSLWLEEWEIRPGDSLRDKLVERIDQAFRESEALVLLLGPKSVDTPSLFFELGAALALRKRIIPVVSKAADRSRIPVPLLRRRYVVQGSPQETAEEVARAVA